MATQRRIAKQKPTKQNTGRSPWKNIFLSLTLVPIVIGILLIGAWVIDIYLWEKPETQITIALFFILLGFAASNGLQGKRGLALGWLLLAVSDIILLTQMIVWVQWIAITIGIIGGVILIREFVLRWKQIQANTSKSK